MTLQIIMTRHRWCLDHVGIHFPLFSMATATAEKPSRFARKYELENRTLELATNIRQFVRKLPRYMHMSEDVIQLLRASGALGAAYIEVNESNGRKAALGHIRECIRQAKETHFWIRVLEVGTSERLVDEKQKLTDEAFALLRIFCAILGKVGTRKQAEESKEAVAG